MTAMNRFNCAYSISYKSALLEDLELGFDFVYPSMDKQKRGNCVIDTALQ